MQTPGQFVKDHLPGLALRKVGQTCVNMGLVVEVRDDADGL